MKRKRRAPSKSPVLHSVAVNTLVRKAIGRVLTLAHQRDKSRRYRQDHPEFCKEVKKRCYTANKEHYNGKSKVYYHNNRESIDVKKDEYRHNNKERLNQAHQKRRKQRRKEDSSFALIERCRARLNQYLNKNNAKKQAKTMELVGMGRRELLKYLEAERGCSGLDGMHVDHIFPVHGAADQEKMMHYSNLQLLTSNENEHKRDRLPTKSMAAKVDPKCWPDGITMDMLPDIYPGWATPLRMHSSGGASCSTDPQ